MSHFFEPFQYPFMRDALLVGGLVGAMCAVLSCYLILKGWSLMGDAISHAVLPGIVMAYIIGLPIAFGAFVAGLLCASASGFISRNSRIKEDTAMGVVFTGFFAVGIVLFSKPVPTCISTTFSSGISSASRLPMSGRRAASPPSCSSSLCF